MRSGKAKVLHELAGRPMVAHVVRTALSLKPEMIFVVVGHQAEEVERAVRHELLKIKSPDAHPEVKFILQAEQRGTGHAVAIGREQLRARQGPLVVLAGDCPLLKPETLGGLIESHRNQRNHATMLTAAVDDPTGYGRIVRDREGRFARCVEQRDGSPEVLAIKEVNVSIYCFEVPALLEALSHLTSDNAQNELYLTDVPVIMANRGKKVGLFLYSDSEDVVGINTRVDLACVEKKLRDEKLNQLMLSGVTIIDPAATYVHQEVDIGQDSVIHPQVIIEGSSRIGSGCIIHSWTRLKNAQIGDNVTIKNSCVIEDSRILEGASVGPFARLRMNAEICESAVIGNFVEVKKSRVGRKTKASHLTYLGDATIGERVNVGAGTVTCNYDGVNKHETVIEDDVQIGSDTMLVAPVRVGRGSKSAAGAVIIADVPQDSLVAGVPATVKKTLT
jgi:bifunctional UDP-N-acetylglucosamine pyrophosphorylase/glucosamine-1-phosphate N-acetyltransferase